MKIYKSNLQGLVEELKGPVYVTATQQQSRARIGLGNHPKAANDNHLKSGQRAD